MGQNSGTMGQNSGYMGQNSGTMGSPSGCYTPWAWGLHPVGLSPWTLGFSMWISEYAI